MVALLANWRIVLAIAGVVAMLGGYAYVRHQGYVDGEAAATIRCEAEKAEQRRANQAAIDEANRRLMRLADELYDKQQELDDAQAALDAAAAADPDGTRECLGLGSVQRLNAIR